MKEYLQVLRRKDFFLLWLGQAVSDLGGRIDTVAILWLISDLGGTASTLSTLMVLKTLPWVLMGPLAGVLVENWPKKTVIVATDLIRGTIAISVAFTDGLQGLLILSALSSLVATFFSPAIRTVIPRLVPKEDLVTANALSSLANHSTRLLGPIVGGVVIVTYGVRAAFVINGLSYLFSALSETWISIPESRSARIQLELNSIRTGFSEGWAYIRTQPTVRFVIALFAVASLPLGALVVLRVLLLKDHYGYTPDQYGVLMTIEGVGLFLGTFFMGKWGRRVADIRVMVWGIGVIGAAYVVLTGGSLIWLSGACLVALGMTGSAVNIAYATYLQKVVADEVRSRVFAFDIAIGEVMGLISMAMAGPLADAFGVTRVVAACGMGNTIIVGLVMCTAVYRLNLNGGANATDADNPSRAAQAL